MARPHASLLERWSRTATEWAGSSLVFGVAVLLVLVWLVFGPFSGWSATWQLWMNTGTTVVTFLMVFLIQRSQNKDSVALHLKLNELVASVRGASARLLNVEDLTEAELRTLHLHYGRLVELARAERSLTESHSIEEAEARHARSRRA